MNEDKKWQATAIIRAMCDLAILLGMDPTHAVQYCFGDLTMTLDRTGAGELRALCQTALGRTMGKVTMTVMFSPR